MNKEFTTIFSKTNAKNYQNIEEHNFWITTNLYHTKVDFNNNKNKNIKWASASKQMERNFKRQAAD